MICHALSYYVLCDVLDALFKRTDYTVSAFEEFLSESDDVTFGDSGTIVFVTQEKLQELLDDFTDDEFKTPPRKLKALKLDKGAEIRIYPG